MNPPQIALAPGDRSESTTANAFPGSPDLRKMAHPHLGPWLDFRATLNPHYWRAWLDIFLCLAMIVAGYAALLIFNLRDGNLTAALAAPIAALWLGFWLNALLTFGHEAAHYNLSPDKRRNDLFADWTIWLFFPQSTKAYRKSHWQHHLYLGDARDTEISYHNCMSPWFLTKAISGIYVLELVGRYAFKKQPAKAREAAAKASTKSETLLPLARAAITHILFLGLAIYFACYATAAAWLVGSALVFPFLATVRQILEHRDESAHCATDYRETPHGAINRMFGANPFARFYGAAGFNRHLLHHWDPTVSYTRFDEMETFFAGTPLRSRIELSRTSYVSSVIVLTRKALRDLR